MKKMLGNVVAVTLAVVLAACEPPIRSGQVVQKLYEPARTWTAMVPMSVYCGQNCRMMTMVPMTHYDDEDFILIIQGWNEKAEEFQRRRIYVATRRQWESIQTGDWFGEEMPGEPYDVIRRRRQ